MRNLVPLLLLVACTKTTETDDTEVVDTDVVVDTDTDLPPQTPLITSATPLSGRVGVGTASVITVTFSKEMNLATVNNQPESGDCAGTMQVSVGPDFDECIGLSGKTSDNRVFTLTPAAPLADDASYRLAVTEGVASAAGIPLVPKADVITFRTTRFPENAKILYPVDSTGEMGGAAGADAKCHAASPLPVGVTAAKAMLTDTTRVACSVSYCGDGNVQTDWALLATAHYVRSDGEFLFTTDEHGIAAFPIANTLGTRLNFWSGLAKDWTSLGPNCLDWTSSSVDESGAVGLDDSTSDAWLQGGTLGCNELRPVFCAER